MNSNQKVTRTELWRYPRSAAPLIGNSVRMPFQRGGCDGGLDGRWAMSRDGGP